MQNTFGNDWRARRMEIENFSALIVLWSAIARTGSVVSCPTKHRSCFPDVPEVKLSTDSASPDVPEVQLARAKPSISHPVARLTPHVHRNILSAVLKGKCGRCFFG